MSSSATEKWGKLTRRELPFLDKEGLEMVLIAQELGADTRISTGNHVIMRSKSGETMAIARNLSSHNRAAQNARAQFKRIFGMSVEQGRARLAQKARREREAINERERAAANQAVADHQEQAEQRVKMHCTTKACPRFFFSREELIEHIKSSHTPCKKFPDECLFSDDRSQSVAAHYRIVHEGMAPRRGTGAKPKVTIEDKPLPRGREDWIRLTRDIHQRIVAAVRGSEKRQGEIAAEIGMDPTAMSKVMNGVRHVSVAELTGIATATGTRIEELLGKESPKPKTEQEQQVKDVDVQVVQPEAAPAEKVEHELMGEQKVVTIVVPENYPDLVEAIQALLPSPGPSKREQELEAELAAIKREFEDLQAKVSLLKETLGL